MLPSAVRRAEPPGDARSQIGFGAGAGDVHAALDQAVDQRADDFRTVHRLAVFCAHVFREAIEIVNLAIEQDDRHLRPRFVVHGRPPGTGLANRR